MNPRNLGAAYGAALDRCNKAEREMLRAIHRWEKYRDELKRAERRLDEAQGEPSTSTEGAP